jgi:hypothetical protein
MHESIKDLWVEALRSGDYVKTKYNLRDDCGYCALGVLCDLFCQEEYACWYEGYNDNDVFCYGIGDGGDDDVEYQFLHRRVMEWADILSQDCTVNGVSISDLNDWNNKTFEEIANHIEENWRDM